MNNFVIECAGLAKSYHDGMVKIDVLSDVNFKVIAGELVAIVGNSGSGKSTFLHLLGGLDKPTHGEIIISGKSIVTLSEKEKCHLRNNFLGFVYQFHHLLPEFTALENVGMPLLIRNWHPEKVRAKARDLLCLVGLEKRLTHKIGELSGGERQRVAIARALVTDPLCVLADEPTGNLDPHNAEKVLQLFLDLQKSIQMSVVMVTHDREIAKHASRTLRLQEGQLITLD
jgi:lipoprotein-releasing system ATP-binding protein